MGLFDFNAAFDKIAGEVMGSAMKAYEENQKYPSVTTLNFTVLPADRAEGLKTVKTGLFGGGVKKNFIRSIEEGRTTFAEVLALARFHRITDRSENDASDCTYKYFYKVADLNGNVIREDVPMIDDQYAISLGMNGGDSASDTGNADKVDPAGYQHMFILQYYIKDSQHYVLLTKEQFEDMSALVKNADNYYLYVEDGIGYRW